MGSFLMRLGLSYFHDKNNIRKANGTDIIIPLYNQQINDVMPNKK